MRRSKPSGPRNPRNARASSAASWKTPEPADVISYSYLWAREPAAGEESGRKDRPAVVVVARIEQKAGTLILVAPVTHAAPDKAADAIEIPSNVKKQLGLDRERSWIVVTELTASSGRDPTFDRFREATLRFTTRFRTGCSNGFAKLCSSIRLPAR